MKKNLPALDDYDTLLNTLLIANSVDDTWPVPDGMNALRPAMNQKLKFTKADNVTTGGRETLVRRQLYRHGQEVISAQLMTTLTEPLMNKEALKQRFTEFFDKLYDFKRLRRAIGKLLRDDLLTVPRLTGCPKSSKRTCASPPVQAVDGAEIPLQAQRIIHLNRRAGRETGNGRHAAFQPIGGHFLANAKPAWMQHGACHLQKFRLATTSRRHV